MREAKITRKTNETDICLYLNIDGTGKGKIDSGIGFLDHMLTLFVKHSSFDIELKCKGDTDVDFHHSTEDIAIVLGEAFRRAIGDGRGINRYADCILPMDEALVLCAADISGRGYLAFDEKYPSEKIGNFDTELVGEFFAAFARCANVTLHIKEISGENSHHICEATFKAFARTMKKAAQTDEKLKDEIPSTKGVL